jgi:hypothetical protein
MLIYHTRFFPRTFECKSFFQINNSFYNICEQQDILRNRSRFFVTEGCGLVSNSSAVRLNYMIKLNWYLVYKNSAGAEADLALIEKRRPNNALKM